MTSHEDSSWLNGIMREAGGTLFALSAMRKHIQGDELSTDSALLASSSWTFQFRTVKDEFLWFINDQVQGILLQHPKWLDNSLPTSSLTLSNLFSTSNQVWYLHTAYILYTEPYDSFHLTQNKTKVYNGSKVLKALKGPVTPTSLSICSDFTFPGEPMQSLHFKPYPLPSRSLSLLTSLLHSPSARNECHCSLVHSLCQNSLCSCR